MRETAQVDVSRMITLTDLALTRRVKLAMAYHWHPPRVRIDSVKPSLAQRKKRSLTEEKQVSATAYRCAKRDIDTLGLFLVKVPFW